MTRNNSAIIQQINQSRSAQSQSDKHFVLSKNQEQILTLSPRQFQVYSYRYSGFTTKQIAAKLGIGVSAVDGHFNQVRKNLNRILPKSLKLRSHSSVCNYLENSGYLCFNPLRIYLSRLRFYLGMFLLKINR